jgi:hypothetical protein
MWCRDVRVDFSGVKLERRDKGGGGSMAGDAAGARQTKQKQSLLGFKPSTAHHNHHHNQQPTFTITHGITRPGEIRHLLAAGRRY